MSLPMTPEANAAEKDVPLTYWPLFVIGTQISSPVAAMSI
jgi:hypothetical protein